MDLESLIKDVQYWHICCAAITFVCASVLLFLIKRSFFPSKSTPTKKSRRKDRSKSKREEIRSVEPSKASENAVTPNAKIVPENVPPKKPNQVQTPKSSSDSSDEWVTVTKNKKLGEQRPKIQPTDSRLDTATKVKPSQNQDTTESNVKSVPAKSVMQTPKFNTSTSEVAYNARHRNDDSDGDWHEVRFSRKGRKSARKL